MNESINPLSGRIYNTSTTATEALRYEYNIKDHLGNTRLVFTDKNNDGKVDVIDDVPSTTKNNEIVQENHYYPFGLGMDEPWINEIAGRDNQYQYNGKELNSDFGLGWTDYGARWYDASLGRWNVVDPLAEKYFNSGSYVYVLNNPISAKDPDGKRGTTFFTKVERFIARKRNARLKKDNYCLQSTSIAQGLCPVYPIYKALP
jgi:RHS repeat-associated protein